MNNTILDKLIDNNTINISDLNSISQNQSMDRLRAKIKTVFERSVITPEIEQAASIGSVGHFFVQKFRTLYFFFYREASEKMVQKIVRDFLNWRQAQLGLLDQQIDNYKLGNRFSPYLSEAAIRKAIQDTKEFIQEYSLASSEINSQFKNRIISHLKSIFVQIPSFDQIIDTNEHWRQFSEAKEKEELEQFTAPFKKVFSTLSPQEIKNWTWKPELGEKPVLDFLNHVQETQNQQISKLKKIYSFQIIQVVAGLYLSDGTSFKLADMEVEAVLNSIKKMHGDKLKKSQLNAISDHLYELKNNPSFYTRNDIKKVIEFLHSIHGPTLKVRIEELAEGIFNPYLIPLMRIESEYLQLDERNSLLNQFLKGYQPPIEAPPAQKIANTLPSYFFNPLAIVSLFPPNEKVSLLRVISRKIGQLDEKNPLLENETFDLLNQAITYYQRKETPPLQNIRLKQRRWDLFFNDLPLLSKQLKLPLPDFKTHLFNHIFSWGALIFGKFLQNPQIIIQEIPQFILKLNNLTDEDLKEMSFLDHDGISKVLNIVDTIPLASLMEKAIKALIKPFLHPENLVKNKEELSARIAKSIESNIKYLASQENSENYEAIKKSIDVQNIWLQSRVENFDMEFETLLYKSEKLLLEILKILIDHHQVLPTVLLIKAFIDWRKARLQNKDTPELLNQVSERLKGMFIQFLKELESNPLEKKILIEAQQIANQFHIKEDEPNKSLAAWRQITPILRNALGVPV